jgi:PTS system mannose-specific IID component
VIDEPNAPPGSPSPGPPPAVLWGVQLRALFVQASWNYRTMQGNGMAWAMLPVLRRASEARRAAALNRHAEHFNGHPYFDSVALGALVRLEADEADPETIRRFRAAIRGPLGALGDRVVWATALPTFALLAALLYWMGAPGPVAAVLFLVAYNALHVAVRLRGFALGWEAGTAVGPRLRGLDLTGRAERFAVLTLVLVGVVSGVLLTGGRGVGALEWPWFAAAVGAFGVGFVGGVRLWRPTAIVTVGAVAILIALGATSLLSG